MALQAPLLRLATLVWPLAAFVLGCGGGGGGGGNTAGVCTSLCSQLTACATTLGTDLATLTGDDAMTPTNCVAECGSQVQTCSNKSGFLSCAEGFSCSSISAVQGTLGSCAHDAGCGGGGGGNASLTLTGAVGTAPEVRNASASMKSSSLAAGDVTTVLALSTGNGWWSSPVAGDGSFSLQVDPSTPVGLVFANAADEMVGYLALSNGLASLPLQTLSTGTANLDLGTLLADAQVYTPESGFAGFSLGDADLTALLNAGGIFAETVKNPDANGNGKIDLLEGLYYRPYVMYFVNPGSFSGLDAVVGAGPLTLNAYRFCFNVSGGSSYPDTVTFSGPEGSGLTGQVNDGVPNLGVSNANYGSPAIQGVPMPPAGRYDVTIGSTDLAFQVPDQTEAIAQIAMAVPTVTLNSNGTVNRIDWTYQLGGLSDAAKTVDPTSLVSGMMLQIEANTTDAAIYRCAASHINAGEGPGRIYDAGAVAADVTGVVLDCQNIPWSIVTRIFMAYNDVYGNHVVVGWAR